MLPTHNGQPIQGVSAIKICAYVSHCKGANPGKCSCVHRQRQCPIQIKSPVQTENTVPHPLPLPLFSPWAGQLLSSLPMGEKRGRGRGWGSVYVVHTQWAVQTGSECHHKNVHTSVTAKVQTQVNV